MSKARIIELQKSLSIAREALQRISYGTDNPRAVAEDALDKIWPLAPKQQLQGVVRHATRSRP